MQIYKISKNDSDQRLDKFLKKLFPKASLSFLYKMLRTNKVKINGKKEKEDYKLQFQDEIKIYLNEEEIKKLTENNFDKYGINFSSKNSMNNDSASSAEGQSFFSLKNSQTGNISKNSKFKDSEEYSQKNNNSKNDKNSKNKKFKKLENIIFEDEGLLVVNKDFGVNVHPGDHKTKEISLIQQVWDYLGKKYFSLTFKPSLIHRIDRDTSGIVLIAKNKETLTKLAEDFKGEKKVKKTYLAYTIGKFENKSGTIDKNILRIENAKNENKVQISPKGDKAISHYKVINEFSIKTEKEEIFVNEVEVNIETGRMHQIRIHLQSIGNPIIGDKTYGDKKLNSFFERNFFVKRQMLHASQISFNHPKSQKKIILKAPRKKDMIQLLENIKKI